MIHRWAFRFSFSLFFFFFLSLRNIIIYRQFCWSEFFQADCRERVLYEISFTRALPWFSPVCFSYKRERVRLCAESCSHMRHGMRSCCFCGVSRQLICLACCAQLPSRISLSTLSLCLVRSHSSTICVGSLSGATSRNDASRVPRHKHRFLAYSEP